MRRRDELREGLIVEVSFMGRLVISRLKWAGHLVRLEEERMAEKADRLRE